LAFINPFSLSDRKIMKTPSNIQMELLNFKKHLILKTKFDALSSVPGTYDVINSGDPYLVKISLN